MKNKLYFSNQIDEERCYTLLYLLDEMKENELQEIEVCEAIREPKSYFFYCNALGEVCAKPPEGEPCGKECGDYEPRNGKSGCCVHSGYCYAPSDEILILTIDGKLKLKLWIK